MRSALVLLSAATAGAAFVPAASSPSQRQLSATTAALPVCRRAEAAQMVTAQEVFGQYFEASPAVQKSMKTMPPPVAKGAMAGLVAVTGAAGFLLTPSRRIAVNTVGGALAANVGNLARKRLAGATFLSAAEFESGFSLTKPVNFMI